MSRPCANAIQLRFLPFPGGSFLTLVIAVTKGQMWSYIRCFKSDTSPKDYLTSGNIIPSQLPEPEVMRSQIVFRVSPADS